VRFIGLLAWLVSSCLSSPACAQDRTPQSPQGTVQGAASPEQAIEGFQKALRDKKWDLAYDWNAPSDRQRMEKEFLGRKLPNLEGATQLLGLSTEELFKLPPREFYIKITQKLDELEPEQYQRMAQAKLQKRQDGDDWVFEHVEEGVRNGVPITHRILILATKEDGKWYVSFTKGADQTVVEDGGAQTVPEQTNASGQRSGPMLSNTGVTAAGSCLRSTRSGSTRITIFPGRNALSAARRRDSAAGSLAPPITTTVVGYSRYSSAAIPKAATNVPSSRARPANDSMVRRA